jgi:hypothetical protein
MLGERFSIGSGMPMIRSLGNLFFTWLVKVLYKRRVKDVCTGYRIFRRKWVPEILALQNDGLDFSLASTIWMVKKKVSFHEMPIHYHVRSGESKLNILVDGLRFLRTILLGHFNHANNP